MPRALPRRRSSLPVVNAAAFHAYSAAHFAPFHFAARRLRLPFSRYAVFRFRQVRLVACHDIEISFEFTALFALS